MIRLAFLAAAAAVLAAPAHAAREFDTRTLACAEANRIVAERGSIVMDIGPAGFERFVASRRFCDRDQTLRVREVVAADTASCALRYVCFRPKRGAN